MADGVWVLDVGVVVIPPLFVFPPTKDSNFVKKISWHDKRFVGKC